MLEKRLLTALLWPFLQVFVLAGLLFASTTVMAGAVAADLVDPLRPPPSIMAVESKRTMSPPPELVLHSTRVTADRREAVINGRRVIEGDSIDGVAVLEISPATVRLFSDETGETELGFAAGKISIRPAADRER